MNLAPILDSPMLHLGAIAQIIILLGAICHVIAGLRTEICDFIINTATLLVELAMKTGLGPEQGLESGYNANQEFTLQRLPTSLYTALRKFEVGGQTTLFAACPSCNYTHEPIYDRVSTTASYPPRCLNRLAGKDGVYTCNTPILESRNGDLCPLKPYFMASFREYLVKLLANKGMELLVDSACDTALSSLRRGDKDLMHNPFDAQFLRELQGPAPGKLFIERGDKVRLAFTLHVDFFNPNGVTSHSNSDSVGMITLALLNLPGDIRYRPENLFLVSVIP